MIINPMKLAKYIAFQYGLDYDDVLYIIKQYKEGR